MRNLVSLYRTARLELWQGEHQPNTRKKWGRVIWSKNRSSINRTHRLRNQNTTYKYMYKLIKRYFDTLEIKKFSLSSPSDTTSIQTNRTPSSSNYILKHVEFKCFGIAFFALYMHLAVLHQVGFGNHRMYTHIQNQC